jgi:hypothetical protein
MLYRELLEAPRTSLPLRKGAAKSARSNYGSLLAVMSPSDFLLLTTTDRQERQRIIDDPFNSLDAYDKGPETENELGAIFHKSQYNMPYLNVLYPSGQVVGHEGRHRAAMVLKAHGNKFPVALYFQSEIVYTVRYTQYDTNEDTDDGIQKVEQFPDLEAARQRLAELKQLSYSEDAPSYYSSIRLDHVGGEKLRGHPGRSDFRNWKYAPWNPTDMPPFLIGQFDGSIRIATTRMAVGALKR